MSKEVYRIADFGPSDLLTSDREKTRRIKTDSRSTAFEEAREARTFYEISLASSEVLVMRASVPIDIVLTLGELSVFDGKVRMEIYAGGTDSGTFGISWPIINKNLMTFAPDYTPQLAIESGGTYNLDGTKVDSYTIESAAGLANSSANVVGGQTSGRGVPPANYYYVFTNLSATSSASATFHGEWEEYPQ